MRKKLLVGLSVTAIIIVFAIFSGGCASLFGGGEETPTATSTTPGMLAAISELQKGLVSLDARLAKLEGNTTTTDTTTLQADLAKLRSDLDSLVTANAEREATIAQLTATIAALQNRIAALEEEASSEEPETIEATARWYWEAYKLNNLDKDVVVCPSLGCSTSPSKIEEADDYKVYIEIQNNELVDINDLQIEVAFRPKTGARVVVDEDEIYLETIMSPFYTWDLELSTRSTDETCRNIIFTSGKIIRVPASDICRMELIFTLAYK